MPLQSFKPLGFRIAALLVLLAVNTCAIGQEEFKLDPKAWSLGMTPSAILNATPMLQFSVEKGFSKYIGFSTDLGGALMKSSSAFRFRTVLQFYPVSLDNFIWSFGMGYNFRKIYEMTEVGILRANGQFTELVDATYISEGHGPILMMRFSFPIVDGLKASGGFGIGSANFTSTFPQNDFFQLSSKFFNGRTPITFFNINMSYQFPRKESEKNLRSARAKARSRKP